METQTEKSAKKKFKNFDETYSLCAFTLAFAFLYPNRTNVVKRNILVTLIIAFNGAQLFWFTTYTFKCLYNLDLYNFARNMTLVIVLILFFIKTYYMIYATDRFFSVLRTISQDLLMANELDEDYQEIYEEYVKQGKISERTWLYIPIILTALFPVYAGIQMSVESIQSDDFTRKMVHDMDLMLVEDIQNETPYFQCMFAYNCVQCVVLVPNFCGLDGSFCITTTHLRLKLKLMTHKIRRAFKDAESTLQLKTLLRDAIKDHQEALMFHKQLQYLYGPWLFAVFLLTSFMISFNLYQIYILNRIDIKYTMFGTFGVLHIFMPCYYCSALTKAGEDICSEIYCAPWEKLGDTAVTKTLIFMIARGQKELLLTGYGIVTFNMELFKSILQTSYSFFTLITS